MTVASLIHDFFFLMNNYIDGRQKRSTKEYTGGLDIIYSVEIDYY